MEAKRLHGIKSHLEMTWAIRTTENRNHRDGIHDTLSIFSWISDPAYPPVLKRWLWDIPFYLASFCATMWFNIMFEQMWVHPSEMVIALHSLLGCHRSPDPFEGCTRRFQCHCPERLVRSKWSGWKVKANKIRMTVLWGSFWPIPSIIFIHSLQLCSTQFPSMNSHGCIFPHQPPSRVRGDVDGGLQNHLKLKNAILLRWPSVFKRIFQLEDGCPFGSEELNGL